MCTADESLAVKKYLFDIVKTERLLKIGIIESSDERRLYYKELVDKINEYSRHHLIFIQYISGKITFEKVRNLLGFEDRQTFRYLKKQRCAFIEYITRVEDKLLSKYKFDDTLTVKPDVYFVE